MGAAASSPLRRRRASWVLAVCCLALVAAAAWSVTRAVRLLDGPSVILPGDGYAAVAVTPDGRTLYVAEYDDDTVIPVNLATGRSGTPIIIEHADLALESALAVTPDGKTLYAALNGDYGGGSGPNSLVAISTATGTVQKTIDYGTAGPAALAVTPDGRTLYALNGNYGESLVPETSTVTPVSTADGRLGGAVRTSGLFGHASARGFALAPGGRTAYVAQGDVVAVAVPR